MTEPFWIFQTISKFGWFIIGTPTYSFYVSDRDMNPYLAPEWEASARTIGRFFLRYAYSTPAGIAYRLTYGIGKE